MTSKQRQFCKQFVVDYNAKQAALRAGYSSESAGGQASRLLKSAAIQEEIQRLTAEQVKKIDVSPDSILKELATIVAMEASDKRDSNLKFSNKLRAIEILGRYLGMWGEDTKVKITNVSAHVEGNKLEIADIERLSDDELMELAAHMYPQPEPLALPAEVIEDVDAGASTGVCGATETGT